MKIVRISDMTDKEKEKWQKQVEDRRIERERIKEEDTKRANQLFNEEYEKRKKQEKEEDNKLPTARKSTFDGISYKDSAKELIKKASQKNKSSVRLATTEETKNAKKYDDSLISKTGYVAKNIGAGALSGVTGIGQAFLTQVANNLNKGKEDNAGGVINNLASYLMGIPNVKDVNNLWNENNEVLNNGNLNIFDKAVGIGKNISSNFLNQMPLMRETNALTRIAGKVLPTASSEKVLDINTKISQPSEKLKQDLANEALLYDNATNTIAQVGQVTGNMAPSILATAITKNPEIGLTVMGASAKGQSTQEALQKGAELDEAVKIGDSKAMIEVGTELLFGGINIFGKGALDDIIKKGIDKKVKSQVMNYLAKQGMGISGEIVEELISDVLDTAIDKGTVDPNASYSIKDFGDTAVTTLLSTLVLNTIGGGYSRNAYNQNIVDMQEYALRQNAIDEINNSNISQDDKKQMLEVLNQTKNVTEADIEAIKNTINEINKTEIENNKLDTNVNYKDNQDRRKKYMQYKNDNTSYDSTIIDEVLNTSPANRNGRRTVKQWLNIAKEIGTRIAEKSNAEIEEIAYKSWFNEEPSKSITQYDSQSHTKANFQRFTSDEWINKIYEGVNEAREQRKTIMPFVRNEDTVYVEDYQGMQDSKKVGGYFPEINISTTDISKYGIKNIDDKIEVTNRILNNLKNKYLSTEQQAKPITNIDTGMQIEIRQRGIRETFGKDEYYNNLPREMKKAKIATMDSLAKLIKYGEVRAKEAGNYHNPNSKVRYAYLEAPIKIDGVEYTVNMDIRKSPNGENRFYIHSLNMNKSSSPNSQSELLMDESTSTNSISPTNIDVNTQKYSMQKNDKYSKQRQQAPTAKNNMESTSIWTEQQSKKIEEKNYFEKYNENKKKILKRREDEINKLISYRNETIRNIENKIAEKEKILNSKKNRDTKVANTIKSQIENLKSQKVKIDNLYNEKIDNLNKKINKEKINYETRQSMRKIARENLEAEIAPLIEDTSSFKDKKNGFLYNRETAQRNIEDIVKNKELAKAINETIFDPVQRHQAEKTREINRLSKVINELELDKTQKYNYLPEGESKIVKIDEATLAQLLIEKKITNTDLKSKYNLTDLQIKKINKTADTFSGILDYLYDKMNEEQIKYGYSPIGKIDNYFPHFFENKADTTLGKIASYFGIDLSNQNLPTEIAGITDTFKPGKTWNGNTLQRKTNKTDYNALKAMERYIQGATDIIYTTEDIQKVRELEREIRYKYSEKGVQESIDKIIKNKELSQEEKDMSLEGIFEHNKNGLPNFTTWLNDYGNSLANKKAFSDRNMEHNIGRNMYSSMSKIEGRIASNTIGGNLSVSLTNFAPLFQSMGTTKPSYMLTGMLQTVSNDIKGLIGKKDISFVDNSTFLTNRFGTDAIAKRTFSQKISDIASIPMNAIDSFTAESIVRAKYLENIDKGMTEEKALDNADKYAGRLMADRSKGAQPIFFNAKNPISKLVTMFQVEPNNIVSNYFKDMPRNSSSKSQLTYQYAKLVGASYAFNTIVMAIRGGNEVLPDPVRWVSYLIKLITGDDDEKEKAKEDLSESIIGNIPFLSNLAGLFGMEDIGRVPISNAFPDLSIINKLSDKEVSDEYKKEQLIKEFMKPFLYLGLPTGGAQIKKTIEGISSVIEGGSYKTDKNGNKLLQFPVENPNIGDYIKAGVFGKYSLPTSKEYAERGYKSLNAKQTKIYNEGNIPYNELTKYIDADLKKNEEKIQYINQQKWTEKQKWAIYTNDIFSNTERKEGGSQLSDAEYITSHGVSKNEYIESYNKAQNNNIDMPTKEEYEEIKNAGLSLEKYVDYKSKIARLKKDSDKINVLINSNYSNKEKQALYENYIKGVNDSKYDIIKSTGLNIDSYLQYKLAESNGEFKADTTDNGTVKGKNISGSAKEKRINYINSIKGATYTQKLILMSLEYKPTTKSDREQVINYIKTLPNKTEKEKLNLLSNFSWITIYKNGEIEY